MSAKIEIPKHQIIDVIPKTSNLKELSSIFNCSKDTMRHILIDYELYESFMKEKGLPHKPIIKEPCCVCGSLFRSSKYKGKYYCKKHYSQTSRGKILDRTIYDANDYEKCDDIYYITLRNVKQDIVGYCIIDEDDFNLISQYKWFLNRNGYCVSKNINYHDNIPIHKIILSYSNDKMCDHINNNKLDNRKCNLRIVTPHQNAMNMSKKNINLTGVAGVSKYTRDKDLKWTATLMYNYKPIYLGRSTSFDEAVKMRLIGEAMYFQTFSNNYNPKTNKIEMKYLSLDDGLIKHIGVNMCTFEVYEIIEREGA